VADPEVWNRGPKGGGKVWPPQKIFENFMQKIMHFGAKLFTCFKMHPVSRGGLSPPLNPPLVYMLSVFLSVKPVDQTVLSKAPFLSCLMDVKRWVKCYIFVLIVDLALIWSYTIL